MFINFRRFCLMIVFLGGLAISAALTVYGDDNELKAQLAAALAKQDAAAIRKAANDMNRGLGDKAGIPEVQDKYLPVPSDGKCLTPEEAQQGFEPLFKKLEKFQWWKIGQDPAKLARPLREPAAMITGNLAVCRAKLKGSERSLAFARDAGDYLIWAQERGGSGVFPFPASRGVSQSAPFQAAEKYMKKAEKDGRLDEAVRNGWLINDFGGGGLQFDNGECGAAILELYEFTREKKYLDAARKSADWALLQPLVVNWNYNSFSVYLLARMYRATGEKKYLEGAAKKALLGVVPGQLTEGKYAGRWGDGHNSRPAYHYIMLRSLAELAAVMPDDDASRRTVMAALLAGLKTRNQEILNQGVPNKDKAMEVLVLVNRVFADDKDFLRESLSADALDALAKLVSEQYRKGSLPLGPAEWGLFLEYVARKGGR